MNIDKTTCWYDEKYCSSKMIAGAQGKLFPVLEKSDHFPTLKRMIDLFKQMSDDPINRTFDLGCGAGEVGRVFGTSLFYEGGDLFHIIEGVARVINPSLRFRSVDVYEDDLFFLKDHSLVLMNAFIDVLEHPLFILEKVLQFSQKFVLLHRQSLSAQHETHLEKHSSYGSFSYQSIINWDDFGKLLKKRNFEIIHQMKIYENNPIKGADHWSIFLKKKDFLSG